jgi:hypothetical protein
MLPNSSSPEVMASKIFNQPNFAFVQTQVLAQVFGSMSPDRYGNGLACYDWSAYEAVKHLVRLSKS